MFESITTMEGEYVLSVFSPSTGRTRKVGPFKNLITNIGLNRIGTGGIALNMYVGTGGGVPAITDTSMFTLRAQTTGTRTAMNPAGAPTYHAIATFVATFDQGATSGNLTEVGVGWNDSPVNSIFSHALIVDGMGNPVTLTVLADEILTVTYILHCYTTLTDVTGTVTISGNDYDYIIRACNQPVSNQAAALLGVGASGQGSINPIAATTFSGNISAVTTEPTGNIGSINSFSGGTFVHPYVSNTLQIEGSFTFNITQGNGPSGTRTVSFAWPSLGTFQCQFEPPIPKDNTKTMTFRFRWTWARHTP